MDDGPSVLTSTRTMWARRAVAETEAGVELVPVASVRDRAAAFRHMADGRLEDAYKLASAILGNPSEARDAVHDAFIAAWQRWPSLHDPERFDPWFRQIIVNVCRDRLRRSSRRPSVEGGSRPGSSVPDVSHDVHDRLLVEQGLACLKPDERIILALRYYRDLKVDDIAEALGVPSGTVKSRLSNAHKRLRDVLERSGAGEESR
jgi:RNA polymerase sigma-70 factor (ECF subfamily)